MEILKSYHYLVIIFLLLMNPQIKGEESSLSVENEENSQKKSRRIIGYFEDYIFNEIDMTGIDHKSGKRASWDFYAMIKCGTGCNPLIYKGYGCYCGFLGSGPTVDELDRCCYKHDWCYSTTSCRNLEYTLPYFVPYKWKCNGGYPICIHKNPGVKSCNEELCECDRQFVTCLAQFECPVKKATCTSPWRYFQNLFMGLGTGMPMVKGHSQHGKKKPKKHFP